MEKGKQRMKEGETHPVTTPEVIRIFLGFDILLETQSQPRIFSLSPAPALCLETDSKVELSNRFQRGTEAALRFTGSAGVKR